MQPLAIDLFCGLGGWTDGLLAEGWRVVGFDIERHQYWMPEISYDGNGAKGTKPFEKRGWTQGCAISLCMEGEASKPRTRLVEYPAQLVLQDIRTLHGKQFRNAALIVASPPCQEFSYMAMPWSRAKAIAAEYRSGVRDTKKLTELFDACFRIQREACEAAGHHIPLVVENVRGAIPWVGRSLWNYGSFHLWGDVPALMPIVATKNNGGWRNPVHEGMKGVPHRPLGHWTNPEENGTKVSGDWFGSYANMKANGTISPGRLHGKGSNARKAASAHIARIPFALAQHIASVYRPCESTS